MYGTSPPPTEGPRLIRSRNAGGLGEAMYDEVAQNFNDPWNGNQDSHMPCSDLASNLVGAGARHEHYRRRNEWWNKSRERLPEQMAHRQKIENPDRSKRTNVLAIRRELILDWPDLCRKV